MGKNAKNKSFVCSECDHQEVRWLGRCPQCGAWNTFEQQDGGQQESGKRRGFQRSSVGQMDAVEPIPLDQVESRHLRRIPVRPMELGRILGGGLVPGSLLLLGGTPGVGKSTLLTMLAGDLIKGNLRVVYLSAEESAAQVRTRAERLGVSGPDFLLVDEPCLERVLPALYEKPPGLLVVDSIQTVHSAGIDGIPGSVSQIRTCGGLLADFARQTGTAVALVGHVTKEGDLAGPRLLEHLVDTVLYFEPDVGGKVRMLRAFKNRFGPTGEVAVMEMSQGGLSPVRDASAFFLAGRRENEPGSAVTCVLSGTRPFLVEVQALVTPSQYGTPARVVSGTDSKRVALLAAILDRKAEEPLAGRDLFVKVAGGLRLRDPAADLAVVAALASSNRERPVRSDVVLIGEVGLAGELRPAAQLAERLHEAEAHGFRRAVVGAQARQELPETTSLTVQPAATVRGALAAAFGMGTPPISMIREEG